MAGSLAAAPTALGLPRTRHMSHEFTSLIRYRSPLLALWPRVSRSCQCSQGRQREEEAEDVRWRPRAKHVRNTEGARRATTNAGGVAACTDCHL